MLVTQSVAYLLARGLPGVMSFLTIALYTRLLSPDDYGRYAIVVAAVDLLDALLFHWLRLALLRYLPGYKDGANQLLSLILGLLTVLVTMSGLAGILLFFVWQDSDWRPLVILGTFLLGAKAVFELSLEYYRCQLQPLKYGLLLGLRSVLALAIGLALVTARRGPYAPLAGLWLALSLCGTWAFSNVFLGIRPKLGRDVIPLLAYGLPMAINLALSFILHASDRLMLTGLLNAGTAGAYSATYDFANQLLTSLFVIVNLAAYPILVRTLETQGPEATTQQLRLTFLLLLGVGLPATLGLVLMAPELTHFMLGPEFRETGRQLLPLVAFASLLAGLKAYYFDLAFHLGQRTLRQVGVLFITVSINILLNLWWIPWFGAPGAAWATVFSYAAGVLASAYWGKAVFPFPVPWRETARLLPPAVAMAVVVYLLPSTEADIEWTLLFFKVACGTLVYVVCLLLLNPQVLHDHVVNWHRWRAR